MWIEIQKRSIWDITRTESNNVDERKNSVLPAAGVLVQVRAGETLIALASSQKPPGFLCAANLDPHQVWVNGWRKRQVSLLAATFFHNQEARPEKKGGSCEACRRLRSPFT